MSLKVLSIVLGGGKGTRLYPLTKDRAKPAVPFGGKFRLVDIPISNCINSGFKQIYICTQFNSASLHIHVAHTYQFDTFSKGFVEILSAEQTYESITWYEGTADAVRKNIHHFKNHSPTYYLVLAGDQLYRMDYMELLEWHLMHKAEITIPATLVNRERASDLGLIRVSKDGRILQFMEKPGPEKDISDWKVPDSLRSFFPASSDGEYLASMGIYLFQTECMEECLSSNEADFGKDIIPKCIQTKKVMSFMFNGFWEDIGTIKSFYETNLNLADIKPAFNIYDESHPIYTHRRDLPASKFNYCTVSQSLAADGCILTNADIRRSIIGIRTIIESGANLEGVVCMGADFYESPDQKKENSNNSLPDIGIGEGCKIKKAIIDKNARIGSRCRIGWDAIPRFDGDYQNYYIKDGIIVIPKNAVFPPDTVV